MSEQPCMDHGMWPCPICDSNTWVRSSSRLATVLTEHDAAQRRRERCFHLVILAVAVLVVIAALRWL